MKIKKPSIRPIFKSDENETEIMLHKIELLIKILLNGEYIDKQMQKHHTSYLIEFMEIALMLEDERETNDELIEKRLNNLYDTIFKNRRY